MPRITRRAFSLVELLVVIAIIAILAALLFPALSGIRARGMETDCAGNLRQMGVALYQYASTYGGTYPRSTGNSATGSQTNLIAAISESIDTNAPAWFCRRYLAYYKLAPASCISTGGIGYFYWAFMTNYPSGLDMNSRDSAWRVAGYSVPSNAPVVLMSDRFSDTVQFHQSRDYECALTEKGTLLLVSGGAVRKIAPQATP